MVTMAGPRKKADQTKKNGISMDHHKGFSLSTATIYREPRDDWCREGRTMPRMSSGVIRAPSTFFRGGQFTMCN